MSSKNEKKCSATLRKLLLLEVYLLVMLGTYLQPSKQQIESLGPSDWWLVWLTADTRHTRIIRKLSVSVRNRFLPKKQNNKCDHNSDQINNVFLLFCDGEMST